MNAIINLLTAMNLAVIHTQDNGMSNKTARPLSVNASLCKEAA